MRVHPDRWEAHPVGSHRLRRFHPQIHLFRGVEDERRNSGLISVAFFHHFCLGAFSSSPRPPSSSQPICTVCQIRENPDLDFGRRFPFSGAHFCCLSTIFAALAASSTNCSLPVLFRLRRLSTSLRHPARSSPPLRRRRVVCASPPGTFPSIFIGYPNR